MSSSPAALVAAARTAAGLTQRALARRASTSAAAINRYERGRSAPDLATLERVLGACGFELHLAVTPLPDGRPSEAPAAEQRDVDRRAVQDALHDDRDGWVRPTTTRSVR
jgi:uncharacterized protein